MNLNKRTKTIIIIAIIVVLLLGIGLMAYPFISAIYAEHHHSDVYGEYVEEVENVNAERMEELLTAAAVYNKQLYKGEIDRLDPVNNGYFDQLDFAENGIMAYVTIPKLGVTLPVFHGTSDSVLRVGAGHMPESSLPVGGENTHSVITAHSGMASDPMFSDLELLEVGDIFQIEVLGQTLTYEVFDVPEPVLPQYVDGIQIRRGEDLCTLLTCTPYGVNTHRLLVHGKRIENPEVIEDIEIQETAPEEDNKSVWAAHYKKSIIIGIIIALFVLLVLVVLLIIRYRKDSKAKGKYEKATEQDQEDHS